MQIPQQSEHFTPMQLDMLRLFSYNLPDEQMAEIRQIIVNYFADKASDAMDKFLEENNIDVEEWVEQLKHEHLRTPYKRHKGLSFKNDAG